MPSFSFNRALSWFTARTAARRLSSEFWLEFSYSRASCIKSAFRDGI